MNENHRLLSSALLLLFALQALVVADDAPSAGAVSGKDDAPPNAALVNLLKRLKPDLPEGWSGKVTGDTLMIRYKEAVPIYFLAPNPPPADPDPQKEAESKRKAAFPWTVVYVLKIGKPMGFEAYDKRVVHNEALRNQRDALHAELRQRRVPFRGRFEPVTEEHRKLVARYEKETAKLAPLPVPTFYLPEGAVYGSQSHLHGDIMDEKVAGQDKAVGSLLETYMGRYHHQPPVYEYYFEKP